METPPGSTTELFRLLARIEADASEEPDPKEGTRVLLRKAVKATSSSEGHIYRLDLAKGAFVPFVSTTDTATGISFEDLENCSNDSGLRPFHVAIRSLRHLHIAKLGENPRLVVPVTRGRACIGLIDLRSVDETRYSDADIAFAECLAAILSLLFEKHYSIELFRAVQQPIDYHQAKHDFLNDLILLISVGSGMPYIVLRQFDPESDTLEAIAQLGFPESRSLSTLNIFPVSKHKAFHTCISERKSVVEPDIDAPHLAAFRADVNVEPVKSFVVVPVIVGKDVFGALAFGCTIKHNFTSLEIAGFESIANSIGVSYTNYRNYHSKNVDLVEKLAQGTAFTTVDVAQAVRHEARGYLGTAREIVAKISMLLENGDKDMIHQVERQISEVDNALGALHSALEKIKAVTKPPDMSPEDVNIQELWNDTFAMVQGRLTLENIDYSVSGKGVICHIAPDPVRHAFLNLILNSIEAFKTFGRKRNRAITVTIETPSEAAVNVKMRYGDNAGGFEPHTLHGPDLGRSYQATDIFQRGVTSKKSGSGYGLFLARTVISEQKGSINLVSHRGGILFEIVLPKAKM